jgi:hypothetical protein
MVRNNRPPCHFDLLDIGDISYKLIEPSFSLSNGPVGALEIEKDNVYARASDGRLRLLDITVKKERMKGHEILVFSKPGGGHFKMKILILGVNGFIGHHLTQRILDTTNWSVFGMDLAADRLDKVLRNPRFHFIEGDISINREWIEYHVKKCDVIIPLVAIATPKLYLTDPLGVFYLDFEMNLNVVKQCVKYGKRVVFPSTSEVYGASPDREFKEDETFLQTFGNNASVFIEMAQLQKARIDALEQSRKELEQVSKAKSRALDHLSHELRTPLAVVQGNVRILKRKTQGQTPPLVKEELFESLESRIDFGFGKGDYFEACILLHFGQYLGLERPLDPTSEKIVPDLADRWEIGGDRLTYSFFLHQGVKFSDGTMLTATDVKYNLDLIRNPPAGFASPRQGLFADVAAVETPDANTVVLKPASALPSSPTRSSRSSSRG